LAAGVAFEAFFEQQLWEPLEEQALPVATIVDCRPECSGDELETVAAAATMPWQPIKQPPPATQRLSNGTSTSRTILVDVRVRITAASLSFWRFFVD
jgi:hypothetical protein